MYLLIKSYGTGNYCLINKETKLATEYHNNIKEVLYEPNRKGLDQLSGNIGKAINGSTECLVWSGDNILSEETHPELFI